MTTITSSLTEQILDRLQTEPVLRLDASLEEYWETLADLTDEPILVEYIDHHIIAQMSQASDPHETIVANIAALLRAAFYDQPDIRVMGSNKVVYIPACELATNPDVLVMQGPSQLMPRKGRAAGITNPYLLVEVRSESTAKEDDFEKLQCYKKLDSVQHILYIDQYRPYMTVYTKNQDNYHWFNDDYDRLDMIVTLPGASLPMAEIYHKVVLPKAVVKGQYTNVNSPAPEWA
jgi:Uma2 family endonuclease